MGVQSLVQGYRLAFNLFERIYIHVAGAFFGGVGGGGGGGGVLSVAVDIACLSSCITQ